jgi:D-alanine-D-alanine ligase
MALLSDLPKIANDALEKLANKRIFIVTGTGDLKRTEKMDLLSEIDTFEVSSSVFETLILGGFKKTQMFPVTNQNISCLELVKADAILNLVEGIGANFIGKCIDEIEKNKTPYTGSPKEAIKLTTDKAGSKKTLEKIGVKTAKYQLFRDGSETIDPDLEYPMILKPNYEDGSVGITNSSVVKTKEELKSKVKEMIATFNKPILGEKLVGDREFSVSIVEVDNEPLVLPIAEVHFPEKGFHGKWKIYNFAAKWDMSSSETKHIYANAPAKNVKPEVEKLMESWSIAAFKEFGMHGYARFDYRLDNETNDLYFLEANANPSLEENSEVEITASFMAIGLNQLQFVALLLKNAYEKFGKKL